MLCAGKNTEIKKDTSEVTNITVHMKVRLDC